MSLRPEDFRCGSLGSADCSCARTAGARATGSTSRWRAGRRRPGIWTSSTAGRCRRRRAQIAEQDFVRLASSTAASPRSSPRRRRALRRRAVLVGDRSRPGDRPLAGRPCLVQRRRGEARRAGARADGRRHDRRSPRGRRSRCEDEAAVHVGARPGECHADAGRHYGSTSAPESSAPTGLYAAGADVGGISTGGYSSGLAAALVFGRIAAEQALS